MGFEARPSWLPAVRTFNRHRIQQLIKANSIDHEACTKKNKLLRQIGEQCKPWRPYVATRHVPARPRAPVAPATIARPQLGAVSAAAASHPREGGCVVLCLLALLLLWVSPIALAVLVSEVALRIMPLHASDCLLLPTEQTVHKKCLHTLPATNCRRGKRVTKSWLQGKRKFDQYRKRYPNGRSSRAPLSSLPNEVSLSSLPDGVTHAPKPESGASTRQQQQVARTLREQTGLRGGGFQTVLLCVFRQCTCVWASMHETYVL